MSKQPIQQYEFVIVHPQKGIFDGMRNGVSQWSGATENGPFQPDQVLSAHTSPTEMEAHVWLAFLAFDKSEGVWVGLLQKDSTGCHQVLRRRGSTH
mgnify:CR=1 FL=1